MSEPTEKQKEIAVKLRKALQEFNALLRQARDEELNVSVGVMFAERGIAITRLETKSESL